jgi:hypothetical protein
VEPQAQPSRVALFFASARRFFRLFGAYAGRKAAVSYTALLMSRCVIVFAVLRAGILTSVKAGAQAAG